jgi:alkanesulfonate monooxygenase SsuD/methylene tetrahydromethanopterin reductase-like flavin-dependent oxidoreductase (luciferase family)
MVTRRLWAGETVTHLGRIVVEEAKLYTRSARPPTLLGAALSVETAEWVGSWAFNVTPHQPYFKEAFAERVLPVVRGRR